MVWKVSKWLGQFPDGLECFQMAWKVSRWLGKFPDGMECQQIYGLESLQVIWKVSGFCGQFFFQHGLECFQKVFLQKLSRFTKTFQVALLPCYLGFSASGWWRGCGYRYRWGGWYWVFFECSLNVQWVFSECLISVLWVSVVWVCPYIIFVIFSPQTKFWT